MELLQYSGSYGAVRRFVRRLRPPEAEVVVRVQREPGEEMQVDFGSAGQLYDPVAGRLRPGDVFVATLSYSRHQYAEIVFDQKMPTWLALHRRAFESCGGVPSRVVPDNLKAAVRQALLYDPVLSEAYRQLALFSIVKWLCFQLAKTSRVHYVKRNFLAGQTFVDLHTANQRLADWVQNIAGTRTHETTRQPPLKLFPNFLLTATLLLLLSFPGNLRPAPCGKHPGGI